MSLPYKTLCSLVLTLALAVAAATEIGVQARSLRKMSPNTSNYMPNVNELQESGEDVVIAIVKGVDHRKHGLVYLDSEIGQILTFAPPAELQDLRAGDLLVLHVAGEDLDDNLV
jgi:hypothetical protein